MMTHAFLNNLANAKSELFTGNLLSCPVFANSQNELNHPSRAVFMAKDGSGSSGSEEKSEEEKKKEKEEEEKKKKEKEEEEKRKEEEKKKGDKGEVELAKNSVARRASEIMETTGKIESSYSSSSNEKQREMGEKMKKIGGKMQKLNKEDSENQSEIKSMLDRMIKEGKISKEKAQELMDLEPSGDGFDDKWSKIIASVPGLAGKEHLALKKIKEKKEEEAKKAEKIEEEFEQAYREYLKLVDKLKEELMDEVQRQRSIEMLSKRSGLPIKPGQKLVALGLREDEKTKEIVKDKKYYEIKKIEFEEIEIKDAEGKVIKKVGTGSPIVTIESQNPITGKIESDQLSAGQMHKWIDKIGVTEDITSLNELQKSISEKIKKGDSFECDEVADVKDPKRTFKSKLVKIKNIDEILNEIELDETVDIGGKKTKKPTFAEFSRWFKKSEAVRPIESVEKLRNELLMYKDTMDTVFHRDPSMYRPIKAVDGEVLHYDDGSKRMFAIKKISDKGVELDNGEKFTLAGFLRWVKRNMVEKRDPDAEADRAVQNMPEGDAKKSEHDAVKNAAEDQMEQHKEAARNPKKATTLPHTDDPSDPPVSYLRKLWSSTELLSLGDLWEWGNTIVEFVKRKMKRWQHGKVGRFGEAMFKTLGKPFEGLKGSLGSIGRALTTELGAEYKGVAQHAENEEVNHHVHHYETMGIETVKHELHEAPNTDILKAAVTVLCKKGQMRWDDPGFWSCVNRLSNGIPTFIRKSTYLDDIAAVFDSWWGNETFLDFKNNQDSSYSSKRKSFEDNAKRLEVVPGGLNKKLQSLAYMHLCGDYVNPCEYEEYIYFAMDNGKMSFHQKLYFLMLGIGTEAMDPHGHGMNLLHVDRVGSLDSELMNKFPVLDYFTQETLPKFDDHGHPIEGQTTGKAETGNFKNWVNTILIADLNDTLSAKGYPTITSFTDLHNRSVYPMEVMEWIKPGERFKNFVNEVMMWSDATLIRLNKASRDATNWDHDDMDFFAPHLSDDQIDKICRYAGGARQQVSTPGLLNAAMGFNDFLKIKMDMLRRHVKEGKKEDAKRDVRHIMDMLRSQLRFHALVDGRYDATNANLSRLGPGEQRQKALNDGSDVAKTVEEHLREVQLFIGNLATEFGMESEFGEVYRKYPGKVGKDVADKQDGFIKEFGRRLEGEIARRTKKNDDPDAALTIFEKAGCNGITGRATDVTEKKEFKELPPDIRLEPYADPELQNLIDENKKLREKATTPEVVRDKAVVLREQEERARQIVTDYENNTYRPKPDDKKILKNENERLQIAINPSRKPEPMAPKPKPAPEPPPEDFDE